MCTDIVTNEPQQKILKKNGWNQICQFKNAKTGNDVAMHYVVL